MKWIGGNGSFLIVDQCVEPGNLVFALANPNQAFGLQITNSGLNWSLQTNTDPLKFANWVFWYFCGLSYINGSNAMRSWINSWIGWKEVSLREVEGYKFNMRIIILKGMKMDIGTKSRNFGPSLGQKWHAGIVGDANWPTFAFKVIPWNVVDGG
ncbi:hypothetical protein L1887_38749 [Cichorium endivia]|nr:hypothetical protein L1887_38749 [Cichorium endivia]